MHGQERQSLRSAVETICSRDKPGGGGGCAYSGECVQKIKVTRNRCERQSVATAEPLKRCWLQLEHGAGALGQRATRLHLSEPCSLWASRKE